MIAIFVLTLVGGLAPSPCGAQSPTAVPLPISAVQSAAHGSTWLGARVVVSGVVTVVQPHGFFLQDPVFDQDDAASEGLFVFTDAEPWVWPGDGVRVTGTVSEFVPGGTSTGNLSTTELQAPTVSRVAIGRALPAATEIGAGGRAPPSEVADDDGLAAFDPMRDGIDFFESLEGMRVRVARPRALSALDAFGVVWVLADDGERATSVNALGGVVTAPGDANPERIALRIDRSLLPRFAPRIDAGDRLSDVTGVLSYSFGRYEVLVSSPFSVEPGAALSETTALTWDQDHLTIASWNVHNLDAQVERVALAGNNPANVDDDVGSGHVAALGRSIVQRLRAPPIVALQEVQDDDGAERSTVVTATRTGQALIDAIVAAGGPTYRYTDVPPTDDREGGQPGGNIRCAFLWDPAKVVLDPGSLQRVTDTDLRDGDAFAGSRRPLLATFSFHGHRVSIVNAHATSRSGSDPLFGARQPPVIAGANRRVAQAREIAERVRNVRRDAPNAHVVVLGDLNDPGFADSIAVLRDPASAGLVDLLDDLPAVERWSYVFAGEGAGFDHVLATAELAGMAEIDIVHGDAGRLGGASDHDPVVARFRLPSARRDVLGTPRADVLIGGDGPDRVAGFGGDDVLTGGAGPDVFVLRTLREGVDTITDFAPGVDRIDLSRLLRLGGWRGRDAVAEGRIRVVPDDAGTRVEIDPDGPSGPGLGRAAVRILGVRRDALAIEAMGDIR